MKIILVNRIAPDGMPRFVAADLGLFCLPMSHKKDARLVWVNPTFFVEMAPTEFATPPTIVASPKSEFSVNKQEISF